VKTRENFKLSKGTQLSSQLFQLLLLLSLVNAVKHKSTCEVPRTRTRPGGSLTVVKARLWNSLYVILNYISYSSVGCWRRTCLVTCLWSTLQMYLPALTYSLTYLLNQNNELSVIDFFQSSPSSTGRACPQFVACKAAARRPSRAGSPETPSRREFCRWPRSKPGRAPRDDKTPLTVFSSSLDFTAVVRWGEQWRPGQRRTYCLKVIG